MSIYPTITKEKQKLYEKTCLSNDKFQNEVPFICGVYGRACRNMDDKANSALCEGCTLSLFVSTVETILDISKEKEDIGIESLYDSDIYDIQARLKEKVIDAKFSYIESVLD